METIVCFYRFGTQLSITIIIERYFVQKLVSSIENPCIVLLGNSGIFLFFLLPVKYPIWDLTVGYYWARPGGTARQARPGRDDLQSPWTYLGSTTLLYSTPLHHSPQSTLGFGNLSLTKYKLYQKVYSKQFASIYWIRSSTL